MQNVCRFSPRWHQQFCQSPSFAPHRKCLQAFTPVRHLRQARKSSRPLRTLPTLHQERSGPSDVADTYASYPNSPKGSRSRSSTDVQDRGQDDLVVTEFEQVGSDKSTRRRIEPNRELKDEAQEIWEEMEELDRDIAIGEQGPFGPQSEFMRQLTPDDRDKILKILAEEGVAPENEEDAMDLAEIERLMEEDEDEAKASDEPAITLRIPRAHQALVNHFNKVLNRVKGNRDDVEKSVDLFRWYLRCHSKIAHFETHLSHAIWNILWQSQAQVRPQHLVLLGHHMREARVDMDDSQLVAYLQALDACGDHATAIGIWEEVNQQKGSYKHLPVSFLEDFVSIGAKLYSATGQTEIAQRIALRAIDRGADPSLLTEVITGWARSNHPEAVSKAWSLYLKMHTLTGGKMSKDTYDRVSNALLDAKHGKMALAVFRDMMTIEDHNVQNYERALGKARLNSTPEHVESAINEISLTMLQALPKQYQNKYFFAAWIKKLIGEQRIESALMVVDLMYERDIKPDAMHLNGIIGAWLRDKSPESRERARKLAWEMIQARVNRVADFSQNTGLRRFGNLFRAIIPVEEENNTYMQPVHLQRPVPAANVETFSLLFDYHEVRRQPQEFERLTHVMMGPAQLKPNIYIINKWLAAESDAKSYTRFWSLFNGMRNEVTFNIESYSMAWQASYERQTVRQQQLGDDNPQRHLFGQMMHWWSSLNWRQKTAAKDDFHPRFYVAIVRSFCYQMDLQATLCAILGMYQTFGVTPYSEAMELISGQVARHLEKLEPVKIPRSKRRLSARLLPDQTALKRVADIVDELEAQRKYDLIKNHDADLEELNDSRSTAHKNLELDVMADLLISMIQRTSPSDTATTRQGLEEVADLMGVDITRINLT